MTFVIFLVLLTINTFISCIKKDEELLLLHVVFRHGARTPDLNMNYLLDPYINEDYYPIGRGELTNKGKMEAYQIGQDLRFAYNEFLGELYTHDVLYAISSGFNRTKMTLELVLAALYPPDESSEIIPGLPWQPIPFEVKQRSNDNIFVLLNNKKFRSVFDEIISQKYSFSDEKIKSFMNHVTKYIGKKPKTALIALELYLQFTAQIDMGHTLPPWSRKVYPQPMENLSKSFFNDVAMNHELRRMVPGNLLKTIIDSTEQKFNGGYLNRKICLYSGHDINIATLLITFGIYIDHMPRYASYIILEVWRKNYVTGVKILYNDNNGSGIKAYAMNGCDEFCPWKKFKFLIKDLIL